MVSIFFSYFGLLFYPLPFCCTSTLYLVVVIVLLLIYFNFWVYVFYVKWACVPLRAAWGWACGYSNICCLRFGLLESTVSSCFLGLQTSVCYQAFLCQHHQNIKIIMANYDQSTTMSCDKSGCDFFETSPFALNRQGKHSPPDTAHRFGLTLFSPRNSSSFYLWMVCT